MHGLGSITAADKKQNLAFIRSVSLLIEGDDKPASNYPASTEPLGTGVPYTHSTNI